jgi:hypothetical protein
MHFLIDKIAENQTSALRKCGYFPDGVDERTGELRFIRSMGGGDFPRFHIYSKKNEKGQVVISLHLDQKRPSYGGSAVHGGEYDGEMVEREAERIRGCASSNRETPESRENLDKLIGF